MPNEDTLRGASTGLTLFFQFQRLVERELGPERTQELVAQLSETLGGRIGQALKHRLRLPEGDLAAVLPVIQALKRSAGIDYEVIEHTHERLLIRNRACPFYDAMQSAQLTGDAAREACTNCAMKIADTAVKQVSTGFGVRIVRFRSEAGDFCDEQVFRAD